MKIKFLMNDESENSYGFKVRTDGINIERFLNNPVALYMHARSGYNRDLLPIGKWIDVKKEDGKLIGTLEFDEDDEFAVKLFKKCEKGILNGTSLGITSLKVIETDDETIVDECELQECSLVDIPSNANTVRFYAENDVVTLTTELCKQLKENTMPSEGKEATELKELQANVIESTFAIALANGNVKESEKAFYLSASKSDFKTTHEHLKTLATPTESDDKKGDKVDEINLNDLLDDSDAVVTLSDQRKSWSYLDWYKNDHSALLSMKKENPKQFKKLHDSHVLNVKSDKNLAFDVEDGF